MRSRGHGWRSVQGYIERGFEPSDQVHDIIWLARGRTCGQAQRNEGANAWHVARYWFL